MPLNDRKIISIIIEQCNGIEEQCPGYREEIIGVITDILQYERGHRVSKTEIQKRNKRQIQRNRAIPPFGSI